MEHREVSSLKINPNNPRGAVVIDDALRELAASIESQGLLQPILITPDGTIVAGHRRAQACEMIGLRTIPVMVRELSESQQIQAMLIENLQREGLTTLQTAKAYQALTDHGLSMRDIAKATGFNSESISRHMDILRLPAELHPCFDGDFLIPLGGIKYLLQLSPADQSRIGRKAARERWLIAQIQQAVASANGPHGERQTENPKKPYGMSIRAMLSQLEEIDEQLDDHADFRAVQALIRQAVTKLIDSIGQRKKTAVVARSTPPASTLSTTTR